MAPEHVLSICDPDGVALDATFDLSLSEAVLEIVFHARYGGKNSPRATNTDYFPALELMLGRIAAVRGQILSVLVDSRPSRELAVEDRTIDL